MRVFSFPVEVLQGLVSGSLGGPLGQTASSPVGQEGSMGPVSLPRRAETFGGFDSHQMNASKGMGFEPTSWTGSPNSHSQERPLFWGASPSSARGSHRVPQSGWS